MLTSFTRFQALKLKSITKLTRFQALKLEAYCFSLYYKVTNNTLAN